MKADGGRFATVVLPPYLGGGNLPALLDLYELDGVQTAGANEWEIRDRRSLGKGASPLIRTVQLAGADLNRERFHDALEVSSDSDEHIISMSESTETVLAGLRHLVEAGELPAILFSIQVKIMTMTSADAAAVAEQQFHHLLALEGPEGPMFPAAAARAVHMSTTLLRRAKFAQMLIRLEQDQDLTDDLMRGPARMNSLKVRLFSAHDAIVMGLTLTDSFLDPLFGCLPPSVWAFSSRRVLTSVVFTLGTGIRDRYDVPGSINSLTVRDANRRGIAPGPERPSAKAWGQSVDWWCSRVDRLLSLVADPTRFTDNSNVYLPHFHLAWLMNVDELFRRVGTISSIWDSTYGTRMLTFAALDLVGEAWYGGDMSSLCKPSRAQEALENIEKVVPPLLQSILLPAARAAVGSLDEIADGFYIGRDGAADGVDIVMPDGQIKATDRERATESLMRMRRNATHGFTGKLADPRKIGPFVMAQHDGTIPSTFYLLPYLYLLEILCDPETQFEKAVTRTQRQFVAKSSTS